MGPDLVLCIIHEQLLIANTIKPVLAAEIAAIARSSIQIDHSAECHTEFWWAIV